MPIEDVRFCIDNGSAIRCRDVCQRMEAVQFLVDIGYELHHVVREWLDENYNDENYMYPGLDDSNGKVTLYREAFGRQSIPFRDIEELIAQSDTLIDERSSEEFSEALMALIG